MGRRSDAPHTPGPESGGEGSSEADAPLDGDAIAAAAMASMPGVSTLVFDRSYRFRAVLGAAVRAHGHDPEQMVGRRAPDVLPAAVWQGLEPLYARVIAGETFTEEIESRDGTHLYETTFTPVLSDGRLIGGMVVAQDVTEERRAQDALEESERLHRMISERSGDVVSCTDIDGRYTYVSHAAVRLYGRQPEEMVGRSAFELVHPEDHPSARAALAKLIAGNTDEFIGEYRMRCADGSWVWVEGRVAAIRGEDGALQGMQAATRGITERRRAEAQLSQAREMFELAFAAAPMGMAVVDPEGRWLKVNPALCELLGRDELGLLSTTLRQVIHGEDRDAERSLAREALEGERDDYTLQLRLLRADGDTLWVRLQVALLRNGDGSPRWFIAQFEDTTERRQLEAELRHQATHDSLTGIWNRARLYEELAGCVVGRRRHDGPSALLVVDLDSFKVLNDELGHEAGDRHLVCVAEAIAAAIRDTDRCARMGGDEFAVVLPGTGAKDAHTVGARVAAAVGAAGAPAGGAGPTTASVGLAVLADGDDVAGWVRRADRAMYEAKRSGGDGVRELSDRGEPGPPAPS